jgi:hypothetical protein
VHPTPHRLPKFRLPRALAALALLPLSAGAEVALNAPIPLTIGALVEVEAFHTDNDGFSGDDASDLRVATVALSLGAQLGDWTQVLISSLYEQDDTPWEIDEAILSFGNPEQSPLSLALGQMYVPFGSYQTQMVSDPFTLDLGETRETAALVGFEQDGLTASAWLFKGDLDDDLDDFGLALGYSAGDEEQGWGLGMSYAANLAESDGIGGALDEAGVGEPRDKIGALGLHGGFHGDSFRLIAEYLSALESFDPAELGWKGGGAEPAAWNLELGYGFEIAGLESTAAIGYQQTREALALGLPETRWSLALSVGLMEQVSLGLELAFDEDYGRGDGGSGDDATTFTALVAVAL